MRDNINDSRVDHDDMSGKSTQGSSMPTVERDDLFAVLQHHDSGLDRPLTRGRLGCIYKDVLETAGSGSVKTSNSVAERRRHDLLGLGDLDSVTQPAVWNQGGRQQGKKRSIEEISQLSPEEWHHEQQWLGQDKLSRQLSDLLRRAQADSLKRRPCELAEGGENSSDATSASTEVDNISMGTATMIIDPEAARRRDTRTVPNFRVDMGTRRVSGNQQNGATSESGFASGSKLKLDVGSSG